jgi:type I restriction enzyme S subunit
MTGAGGLKRVSPDVIRKHRIYFPSSNVQRLIANYLDLEIVRIDALVAEKEHMLALLEEKRAALISRAVTCGLNPNAPLKPSGLDWLGDIPMHWGVDRLKYHLRTIEQGWSPQCDNSPAEPEEWGVLKVGSVNSWVFDPTENKRLPEKIDPLTEYEIKYGDVLMSRANTTQLLGSVACVPEIKARLLLCDKLYRLQVVVESVDREFLVAVLRSKSGRFQLEREASGTSGSMQNIGQDTVQNCRIAVPPIKEQKKIVKFISEFRNESKQLEVSMEKSISLLKERRAALITAAITGQIPIEEMTA